MRAARTHFLRLALLAAALVPLAARTASAQTEDRDRFRPESNEYEEALPYPADSVWRAVSRVYAHLGFPVMPSSDTTRHVYLTPFMDLHGLLFNRSPADFFVCPQYAFGAGNVYDSAVFTFAMRAEVHTDRRRGTLLWMQTDPRARRRTWNSSSLECSSNGELEKRLTQMVRDRLREMMPAPPAP